MDDRAVRVRGSAGFRIAVSLVIGVIVALISGAAYRWAFAPAVGWAVAGAVFLVGTWLITHRMDASSTARHAAREDPTLAVAHLILLAASIASLGGVVLLLVGAESSTRVPAAVLGVLSVAVSWLVVHTVYTLRYAATYYTGTDGGIDFNQKEPPAYADFAYFGFTIGMTYQVSDTTITEVRIRRLALQHALVSYLLGAVVLAITLNLVVNIGSK